MFCFYFKEELQDQPLGYSFTLLYFLQLLYYIRNTLSYH